MNEDDPRSEQQVFHDASTQLPVIAWGLVTAALDRGAKSIEEYADEMAELTNDAARLVGGRAGHLALFHKLSETAADLLVELAEAKGVNPHELAQERAVALAERAERWRQTRPAD